MKKDVLSVFFLLTLLACQKKTDVDGKMIITVLGRSETGEETTGAVDYVNETLGEEYGFQIVLNGTDQNDSEKLTLLFSSGDIPDYMLLRGVSDPIVNYYQDGVIRGIPKSYIREYMPNYQKLLDEKPMGKLLALSPDNDEEVLGILNYRDLYEVPLYFFVIRDDWSRAAGFDFGDLDKEGQVLDPRQKTFILPDRMSITLEELEQLMAAIKAGITVNGESIRSIPLGIYGTNLLSSFGPILGAFGIASSGIYETNGQLLDVKITPGYREFLSAISKWYKAGYIDPEFQSTNTSQYRDKLRDGITAMGVGGMEWVGADWARNRPPNTMSSDDDPNSRALVFPLVAGKDGQTGGQVYNSYGPYTTGSSAVIRADVSDEKLINILRVIEHIKIGDIAQKGNDESWLIGQYGLPGIYFDWEGEPYQSYPVIKPYNDVSEGYPQVGRWPLHFPQIYTLRRQKFMIPGALNNWWSKYWANKEGTGLGQIYGTRRARYDIYNETNLDEINERVGEAVNTLTSEFYVKALTGEVDVDDDAVWNEYVQNWYDYGGREILEETAKAPLLSELLKGNVVY